MTDGKLVLTSGDLIFWFGISNTGFLAGLGLIYGSTIVAFMAGALLSLFIFDRFHTWSKGKV